MNNMKQDWEIKKLSEVGKIFNGNSINAKVKKERYTDLDEGLPYIAFNIGLNWFFVNFGEFSSGLR